MKNRGGKRVLQLEKISDGRKRGSRKIEVEETKIEKKGKYSRGRLYEMDIRFGGEGGGGKWRLWRRK